jgi:protoheme IX farnesyltransferase
MLDGGSEESATVLDRGAEESATVLDRGAKKKATVLDRGASVAARRSGLGSTVRAYVAMTKPRIVELLLVTTVPAMVLAERGVPPLGLLLATLVGGTLSAGSAHAFNQVLERDIDAGMTRTAHRPVATTHVSPVAATVYAAALLLTSVAVMLVFVNPLATALTVAANAFYVLVYTVLLKRRTAQNIVWGGVAGCMPTLIGWAAVTGELAWPPVVMFAIVFFWTPPHYWPLAIRFREDYAAVGVPMLPVVASPVTVTRQIVLYTWATVITAVLLVPVGDLGWIYALTSVVGGGWFAWLAHRLHRETVRADRAAGRPADGQEAVPPRPMRLFHASITYLSVVFLAIALDVLLLG